MNHLSVLTEAAIRPTANCVPATRPTFSAMRMRVCNGFSVLALKPEIVWHSPKRCRASSVNARVLGVRTC